MNAIRTFKAFLASCLALAFGAGAVHAADEAGTASAAGPAAPGPAAQPQARPAAGESAPASARQAPGLDGRWIEVRGAAGFPPAVLEFRGGTVRFSFAPSGAAEASYEVRETEDGTVVTFEHSYTVRRGNGRLVRRTDSREYLLHGQEIGGRMVPVLSETAFELDGRGAVIMSEFLRGDDLERLGEDFRSGMARRLDAAPAQPAFATK